MAINYKVLGQVAPTDTNNTNIYTVPSSTQTIISTISISNITTSGTSYRIAVRPSGDTIGNKHWIAYDISLGGNDSISLTLGITMNASDILTVRSGTSNSLAFSIFGAEIT